MRKLHVLMLAIGAVCAFGAITATSAFAFTEFLAGGETITEALDLTFDIEGELILEGLTSLNEILCSGIFDGLFISGTLGEINEILMLGGLLLEDVEALSLTLVLATGDMVDEGCVSLKTGGIGQCENMPDILVTALKLPWHVTLESPWILLEGVEYYLDCLNFGLLIENTCSGSGRALLLTDPTTGDAAAKFELEAPNLVCDNGEEANALSDEEDPIILDTLDASLITLN